LDLDTLDNVEESSYHVGYDDGHHHGVLHGKFEGRSIGRTKGFELWEEVGYYESMSQTWLSLLDAQTSHPAALSRKQQKQRQQLVNLLSLIASFPMANTASSAVALGQEGSLGALQSHTPPHKAAQSGLIAKAQDEGEDVDAQLDILDHLERIRARYKSLCSVLGVRQRIRAADAEHEKASDGDGILSGARMAFVKGRAFNPEHLAF
ncbi:hypothetical protein IE81DRAFT_288504, partial [Ceraceosorus guamensis]